MKYTVRLLGIGLLLATGCIETKQEYTLNPDNSGKVTVVSLFQPLGFDLTAGEEKDPDKLMRDNVRDELEKSSGVAAWRDVSYRRLPDGRVQFNGVAYFTDLGQLRLHNAGFAAGFEPRVTRDAQGVTVLELREKAKPKKPAKPAAAPVPADVTEQIARERAKYQQMRPMMLGLLATLKMELTFRLPGKVEQSSNFQVVDPGTVRLVLDGNKMLAAMDGFMADDQFLQQQMKAGLDFQESGPDPLLLNEKMYGQRAPVRVSFKPGTPAGFDFAAEVAAAKQAAPAMLKSLKLDGVASALPPAQEGKFKGVTVVGVQLVTLADQKRGVQPFNHGTGYSLAILAELPGPAISVAKGRLTKALADTGEDLQPERDWDRQLRFPRLTADKSAVVFEVTLALPGEKVRGLQELSGTLEYFVASKTREIDLGISEFAAGVTGQEFGATIKSIKASEWQPGSTALSLRLQTAKEMIKAVTFYDATGAKLDAKQGGSMSSGTEVTLDYNLKGTFPAKGKIVVEAYDGGETFTAPFTLKNVSLLGRPLTGE